MADGGYIREYLVGLGFQVDSAGLEAFRAALEGAQQAAQALEALQMPSLSGAELARGMNNFPAQTRRIFVRARTDAESALSPLPGRLRGVSERCAAAFSGFPSQVSALFSQAAQAAQAAFAPAVSGIAEQARQIQSAVQSAMASVRALPSAGGGGNSTVLRNAEGGVYDRPALTTLAEGGAREYVIPVEKPQRAAPLLRAAMNDLGMTGPGAQQTVPPLPAYAAAPPAAQSAPVTTNNTTNRIEAPVTLKVYGSDASATAAAVSRTLERRLAHNLRGRVRI